MKKLSLILMCALTIATIVSGCKKDGATGPAGPAGPQGIQGTPGATGPAGSANVIYSPWITAPKGVLVNNLWYYDYAIPQLTADHVNNGVLLAYIGDTNVSFPLPFTEGQPSGTGISYFTNWDANQKKVTLNMRPIGTIPANWAARNLTVQFRYVIIPGTVKTAMSPDVNLKDYNEVAKYFNIK